MQQFVRCKVHYLLNIIFIVVARVYVSLVDDRTTVGKVGTSDRYKARWLLAERNYGNVAIDILEKIEIR